MGKIMELMPDEIEEAKRNPNGWVYRIEGTFGPNDVVPPEAIVGAWKVDAEGKIVGDFVPNRKFTTNDEHERSSETVRDKVALWITVTIAMAIATWLAVRFFT